jgi:hypothetical protein
MTDIAVVLIIIGVLWAFIAIAECHKAHEIAKMDDDDLDGEGNPIPWQQNRS